MNLDESFIRIIENSDDDRGTGSDNRGSTAPLCNTKQNSVSKLLQTVSVTLVCTG